VVGWPAMNTHDWCVMHIVTDEEGGCNEAGIVVVGVDRRLI